MKAAIALLFLSPAFACAQWTLGLRGFGEPASYQTYTDGFTRANGALGSNWAEPFQGNAALTINSDLVYSAAPGVGVTHSIEVYEAGTFSNNQYSIITVTSGIGTDTPGQAGQFAAVRGSTTTTTSGQGYYNDAVATGSDFGGLSLYRIGNSASTDFCGVTPTGPDYAIGDTHELDVAGTNPVFFWSKHNGVVDATCFTTAYAFSGGEPGLGVLDPGATPQVSTGAWQGGSLPNYSATPSDNFTRANSGWLGVNWWMDSNFSATAGYFGITSNAAAMQGTATNRGGVALWTTPMAANHSSTITIGNLASGDWLGAAVRGSLGAEPDSGGTETYYLAIDDGGSIFLFAYNASTYETLWGPTTYTGAVNTIELDATGSSPVSLVVKINGVQFGSTFTDSTYNFTGTYAGLGAFGSANSNITGWSGANL
jgi:hypothetical protein